ncbi:MAG: molybdopterin oxidoreductase family protein [Thermoleophilaceae bacterium]
MLGTGSATETRRTIRGACLLDCPDTCATLVDVDGDTVLGLRGDPQHPFTAGSLCPKVHDYERRLYSPDRVLEPLRRVGPKGSGRFEAITWDDALDEIAERLGTIAAEDGPEAILPFSYLGNYGLLNGLAVGDPFFHRLGASVCERSFCDSGSTTALRMTVGRTVGMDPESFAHSRYIVVWACNVQATNLHLWKFIRAAQRRGAKVVVIDPLRTRTAAKADWHIPIRPGTDAALALGMMNVIVGEGLVDTDYVDRHAVGFDELAERVRDYPPSRVAAVCGIPEEDVVRLGREYALGQPAAIRLGVAVERHASGGQAIRAISSLPALVGAWRRVGGGLLQLTSPAFPIDWPALQRPDWIRPGTRVVNQYRLGAALSGELGLDPPIRALFVYNSNPLVTLPEQRTVAAGLASDDLFTVVGDHFLTDTARYADIVLPNATMLEQFDIVCPWGQLYVTLNQPASPPLGESVSNREMFRRLAERMGFDDEIFFLDDREAARRALRWDDPSLAGITLERLEEDGWARLSLPGADELAPHAQGSFPTPSGKCELKASLAEGGNFVVPTLREGYTELQSGEPLDPLPHQAGYDGDLHGADRHPLILLTPKAQSYLNSQFANMPRQRKLQGSVQSVLIHPDDAATRGIAEGELVRIANDRGDVRALATLTDEVARGVLVSPLGHWRDSQPGEATVNAITAPGLADMGNAPTFSDTAVEVHATTAAASREAS